MAHKKPGYHGVLLDINLTTGKSSPKKISSQDIGMFIGGRGLGMKILWDRLKKPGIDPLSPENPLMFMPGPFSGFPIPSSSRTCVVTKSPCTSSLHSSYPFASTVSYSNVGGFFGPEIRFAGYDGIVITGRASAPVYIVIDNDRVEIREAKKFWGMGTDEFDKKFIEELGDRRFRTCYIGPAGENQVSYACIIHTAARAAGRGTGCVMGSKNLKAIAVRGSMIPDVADHKQFLAALEEASQAFKGISGTLLTKIWRRSGTAVSIERSSKKGSMAVKNYREGTFSEIDKIGADAARKFWIRDFACFCCPLSCKKSGVIKNGAYAGLIHDGPEYETGTMFGANLMVSDLEGLMKAVFNGDDYGLDIISTGNVIGFLMEAYEKGIIDKEFLDGIELKWGNIDAILKMIDKIAKREGVGDLASKGVKALSKRIGKDSEKFAIHVKGLELAAWNVHVEPPKGICYATSNRGACHQSGNTVEAQNFRAMIDSIGICRFTTDWGHWYLPGLGSDNFSRILTAITGIEWTKEELMKSGERIFNLEKMINYREGFRRVDDNLPDRFFEEPLSVGSEKGAVLHREKFSEMLDEYYKIRGWDPETTKPGKSRLERLGLSFTLQDHQI
ncbi:MAG: aldehyde ferredoxin oxidoreductase family protein [Nanoarchaeota archaeon]|nr:aldehyde ferredoxin oxidoreductase family protein [Nanoarchaeota archaeon]